MVAKQPSFFIGVGNAILKSVNNLLSHHTNICAMIKESPLFPVGLAFLCWVRIS